MKRALLIVTGLALVVGGLLAPGQEALMVQKAEAAAARRWNPARSQVWLNKDTVLLDDSKAPPESVVFDGKTICFADPCKDPANHCPPQICFKNTAQGHHLFISYISQCCAWHTLEGPWDLPYPNPEEMPQQ